MEINYPTDIVNLIFEFSYGFDLTTYFDKSQQYYLVGVSLPVPNTWKRNIKLNPVHGMHVQKFNWKTFGEDSYGHSISSYEGNIDLPEVVKTVQLLNWNNLRSSSNLIHEWTCATTKREALHVLKTWSHKSKILTQYVQRTLLCIKPENLINRVSLTQLKKYIMPRSSKPLSFFLLH